MAFADALLSSRGGAGLYDELLDAFPQLRRSEIYLGISIAWLARTADLLETLTVANHEIRQLRHQLEEIAQRRAA